MQKNPIIVAVVGLTGSGKTDATLRFIAAGFARVGFNDPVYEELLRQNLERNEKNERAVREQLRRDFGASVMADRSLERIEQELAAGKKIVVESLYSWAEYKTMKEKFGERFFVLAIYAPPDIRYQRLGARPARPLSPEIAASRDYAEIEPPVEKAGPIAMADWTIANIYPHDEFINAVDVLIADLKNR